MEERFWRGRDGTVCNKSEPFVSGKVIGLFGSYGWGDGQWMRDWQDRVSGDGAQLFEEGLMANGAPDEAECEAFGKRFSGVLSGFLFVSHFLESRRMPTASGPASALILRSSVITNCL